MGGTWLILWGAIVHATTKTVVRNNVDTSTYRPLHSIESCHCTFAAPNLQRVLDIVDAGDVPVIQVVQEPCTQLKVSSQSSERAGIYVAISPVWVDGLGSTTEVGVPKCRLERLGGWVEDATGTRNAPFWIDSLCIPSLKEQRRKSIGLLKNIYQYALKVMIIDRAIPNCPENAPAERLLCSIISSPWMQRLWTYQESYLATKIVAKTEKQSCSGNGPRFTKFSSSSPQPSSPHVSGPDLEHIEARQGV